jgi:Cellulase (glycosyl hydrolase family 5)
VPRLRSIVLVAVSALALALPAAASAAPAVGISINRPGDNPAAAMAQLNTAASLHMKVVRVELLWNELQPNGPGSYDADELAATDRFFAAVGARHMKALLLMDSTPCWASSAPASLTNGCKRGTNPSGYSAWPPTNPSDFAKVAAFVAARYSTLLEAFEVWNEPDQANQSYFAGPNKPQRYAALLRAAYPALKAAAPGVPVLGGAIVGYNGLFLKQLYAAGIKGYYDGLSVHFYDLVLADLRTIHQVQLANGDHKPMWLAEFGWSSCAPARTQAGQVCVNQKIEGQNIVDIIRALRTTTWVREMYIYSMVDTAQYNLGLLGVNNRPKPAFPAVQAQLAAKKAVKPRAIKLALRRTRSQVVAMGSGPAGDLYVLSVYQGRTLRFKATLRLNWNNQFTLKLPPQLGRRGLRVTLYQQWQGSKHAVTKRI